MMTDDAERMVERTLGILLAKVEGIERALQQGEMERRSTYKKIDALGARITDVKETIDIVQGEIATIKSDFNDINDTVTETKGVTDEVKRWKYMGMGALAITGIASSAITAIIVSYTSGILKLFLKGG